MKKINKLLKLCFMLMFILTFCSCSNKKITFEVILETNIESGYE